MSDIAEARMWAGLAVVAFLLICAALGYQAGYGEGKDRAMRDNAHCAMLCGTI